MKINVLIRSTVEVAVAYKNRETLFNMAIQGTQIRDNSKACYYSSCRSILETEVLQMRLIATLLRTRNPHKEPLRSSRELTAWQFPQTIANWYSTLWHAPHKIARAP